MAIDTASAALSLLTVAAYIAQTYEPPQSAVFSGLRTMDFVLSLAFGAEWCFWLWLARGRRLRFVFSLQSLVDLVTVVPMVVAYLLPPDPTSAFQAVERMVRILRILRVFRIFKWVGWASVGCMRHARGSAAAAVCGWGLGDRLQ